MTFRIYTDGAYKWGIGGWAYLILRGDHLECQQAGQDRDWAHNHLPVRGANCNRMELTAAVRAVEHLATFATPEAVYLLYSDSGYVINGVNYMMSVQGGAKPEEDDDLWARLAAVSRKRKGSKAIYVPSDQVWLEYAHYLARVERLKPLVLRHHESDVAS